MVVVFLVLHIVICIVVYVLIRIGILKCGRAVMPLAVLVPVWGLGSLVVLEFYARGSGHAREEVGLEKLKINDEVHRSILMEEDPVEHMIVPLEEALLVNDPATRRQLMMEVMYSDPDDYVGQLQEARMNDDTEVVHYAVTALAELQKEYELRFQKLYHRMEENPEDERLLAENIALTEQYLASGLPEGNAFRAQLHRYSDLLKQQIGKAEESLSLYCKKIEADLLLGEYETACQEIETVLERWPQEESGYLYLLKYNSLIRSREGIDRVLAMIRQREVYLSAKGRSETEFWNSGEKV